MPSSSVEQIKSRLSMVDVASSYIKLVRAGANFKAVCPFHSEKTPSLFISPARDVWHCFGCGKGGDQFRFVMDIEGLDFKEALEVLARRAGVEIAYEAPEVRNERSRLLAILEESASFYESNLAKSEPVKKYLKERGVADDSIREFRVGYALPESTGWRTLLEHLEKKGYKAEEIEKAGLLIKNPKADSRSRLYYDRFRNRIIFPINDFNGRPIGFGGRIFGPASDTAAKYINTPQTGLYDKSRVLYAFDKAKVGIRSSNTVLLVEGYMDALMAHQAGTVNTVAVSGTALTPPQLQALRRLADKLKMSFDSDEAGESATRRSIDMALEAGFDVAVIGMKEKDPADVVKENPALWIQAVEAAKDAISFFLEKAVSRNDPSAIEGKRNISRAVLPLIAKIPQEIDKAHWVSRVAKTIDVKEEAVWSDLKKIKTGIFTGSSSAQRPALSQAAPKSRLELLEERVLGMVLSKPGEFLGEASKEMFSHPLHRELFARAVSEGGSSGDPKAFLADMPPEHQAMAHKFIFEAEMLGEGTREDFKDHIRELERERLKASLEKLSRTIRLAEDRGDKDEVLRLAGEFSELSKKLSEN